MKSIATIRASSWPSLFDCAHRWYWQNVVGLSSPSSGAATIGTAIHAGTAKFDAAVLEGREQSVEQAVDEASMTIGEEIRKGEVVFDGDLTVKTAVDYAVSLTARYCQIIAPRREYTAVEIQCTSLSIETPYGVVCLTGTADRIRILADGRKGVSDLKSGARATEKTDDGGRRAVTKGHHLRSASTPCWPSRKAASVSTRRPRSSACKPARKRPGPRATSPT
jgi:hypothetical protein